MWYTYTDSGGWELTNKITIRGQIGAVMSADPGFNPTTGRVDAALTMAQSIVNRPMPEADHDLLPFANGVLHVPTGELRPHAPYPFTLGRRPYDYDPDAKCPRWIKFLHEVLEDDPQRIAQLQEALGYLLSGDTSRHKIFIFIGPPRCGKGTTCRVIIDLVGPRHCTGGTLTSLPKDATLHSLVDKSVMVIGDAENKIHPSHRDGVVATLKSLSGGDAISFDRKFKSKATAILPTRLFIASNTVPAIFDDSGALGNRMVLIHTDFSALGNEDRGLEAALREEMPGIANWALAGSARLEQLDQVTTPDATTEALEEIMEGFSPMLTFVRECCDFAPAARTTTSDLHKRWDAWRVAEEGQAKGLSRSAFSRSLKAALQGTPARVKKMRIEGESVRGVEGLRLKPVEGAAVQNVLPIA